MTKKLILLLTIATLSAQQVHTMSFRQKLMANHTDAKHSTTEKRDIALAKSDFCGGIMLTSLATLAGYGIKAVLNKSQGKLFSFPRGHKVIVAAAAGLLAISTKRGIDFQDICDEHEKTLLRTKKAEREEKKAAAKAYNPLTGATFDAPSEPADLSTPELIIAESKKIINELAAKQQPLLPASVITKDNMQFAYFGKQFNDRLQHWVARAKAVPELTAELTRLLAQPQVAWNELSEMAKVAVLLTRIGQQKVIQLQLLHKTGDFSYDQVSSKITSGIICTNHMELLFYPLADALRLYKKLEKNMNPAELQALLTVEGNPFLATAATTRRVKQPIMPRQLQWRHTPAGIRAEGQRLIHAVQNCDEPLVAPHYITPYNKNAAYFGWDLTQELMAFINHPPFGTLTLDATLGWENLSEMTQLKVTLYHAFSHLLVNDQLSAANRDEITHNRQMLLDREPGLDALYNRLKATNERCFTPAGNPFLPPA